MAKTKQQKKEALEKISSKLKEAKGIVFSSFTGLTVSQMEELRGKLREENSELIVAKKTLLKKSLQEAGQEDVPVEEFSGGVSMVVGDDEVAPAKVVAEFAKKNEAVEFYGGILEAKYIDENKVKELAKLPSKQELLAKMVGSMKAPISGFANVLSGNLRNLVYVLNAIKDKKE